MRGTGRRFQRSWPVARRRAELRVEYQVVGGAIAPAGPGERRWRDCWAHWPRRDSRRFAPAQPLVDPAARRRPIGQVQSPAVRGSLTAIL